ncbi:MAG: DnaB-like helicase C-terminal domain-containing protein [Candidatus Muiribacteriaceae bacterium]
MKKTNALSILKESIDTSPVSCDFRLLSEKINGFWNEVYIFGSASGMGKTSFVTNLAWNIVSSEENTEALFFSFDHPSSDISIKLASGSMDIPFSYLKDIKNDNRIYDRRFSQKLKKLKSILRKITIIDNSHRKHFTSDHIIDLIEKKRKNNPHSRFITVIDQLYNMYEDDALSLLYRLKKAAQYYRTPLLITMSLPRNAENTRPLRKHMKTLSHIMSLSYVFFTLYTDFVINYESPFVEWDWQKKDTMVPITELTIHKNKIEDFTGSLFYRFYNSTSSFTECIPAENDNYRNMTENLDEYSRKKRDDLIRSSRATVLLPDEV